MFPYVYLIPMTALYIHLEYCYTRIIMYTTYLPYYVLWTILFWFLNDFGIGIGIGIGIYLHSINLYKRCGNSHNYIE